MRDASENLVLELNPESAPSELAAEVLELHPAAAAE